MKEYEYARRQALGQYFRLVEDSAKTSELQIIDIIRNDFANLLLPEILNDQREPTVYRLQTRYGYLTLDTNTFKASSPFLGEGTKAQLTRMETVVLRAFMRNPDYLYSKAQLTLEVDPDFPPSENAIRKSIVRLRKKLNINPVTEGKEDYPLMKNLHGTGYVLLP